MKRLFALTLLILVLTASPALAALRVLPEDVQERLHDVALEANPGYQVTDSWVQDFVALGREVFNVNLLKDGESLLVHVDIAREEILGEAEYQQIVQAEAATQEENPIFTTLKASDLGVEEDQGPILAAKNPGGIWLAGGLALLVVTAGLVLYIKRR